MKKMLVILLALFSMGFAISAFASPWTVNYVLVNKTNQNIPVWTYKGIDSSHVTETSELGIVTPGKPGSYSNIILDGDTGIGFGDFRNASEGSDSGGSVFYGGNPYVVDAVCSVDNEGGLQWGLDKNDDLDDISADQDTPESGTTYTLDGQQYPFKLLAHWNSDHNETVTVTIG